jgi:hypothetical protein
VAQNKVRVGGHNNGWGIEIIKFVKRVYEDKVEDNISQFQTNWTMMSSPVYHQNGHKEMLNELDIIKIRN